MIGVLLTARRECCEQVNSHMNPGKLSYEREDSILKIEKSPGRGCPAAVPLRFSDRAARAAAGMGHAGPAASPQAGGHHRRAPAGTLGEVHDVEAERADIVHGEIQVVAVPVLVLSVAMVGDAVQFHRDAIELVPVVLAVGLAVYSAPGLPGRRGQAMRALDIAGVAAFEREMGAFLRVGEGVVQPGPAGEPRSAVQRAPEFRDGYRIAAGYRPG